MSPCLKLRAEQCVFLRTPPRPHPAFEAGHDVPPGSGLRSWTEGTPYSYPFNLTQQPAASIPGGFTSDGLPVGLQIVGPKHRDDMVLTVSAAYETLRPVTLDRKSTRLNSSH